MPRKAVYIDYLFVHPKCRRKGCGKQILDKMLEDLQSSGVDYVFLNATQDAYVVKIYTDRGFVPANEHVNAPFPLSETTARMNKYMMKILFDDGLSHFKDRINYRLVLDKDEEGPWEE
mmetsp:Transcript_61685/g.150990  ORF Transcript_61685/g.150990 Transcript_61685/m.150990 type:complete len:118 (-) Transcript_61685:3-356(-)